MESLTELLAYTCRLRDSSDMSKICHYYRVIHITVWLYHGSPGGVLETEELSPPNIKKTWFICVYKTICKVKLEDVLRTVDWLLILIPSASLPAHSGEVREMLREAKALCNGTSASGPAHVQRISTLASKWQINFLWWLVTYFAFLKISRHWSIANDNLLKNNTLTPHSVLTLTSGTTGPRWQRCFYFLPCVHCLQGDNRCKQDYTQTTEQHVNNSAATRQW